MLALIAGLLAGCASGGPHSIVQEGNYLTFDHAFTDQAADAARLRAEQHCAGRKQMAVRTTAACSLKRCTTNFQCMDKEDAARFLPAGQKK